MMDDQYRNIVSNIQKNHGVKGVRIQSYSGPHFPLFGLNKCGNSIQYSIGMRENADQNNSKYGHFLRSEFHHHAKFCQSGKDLNTHQCKTDLPEVCHPTKFLKLKECQHYL